MSTASGKHVAERATIEEIRKTLRITEADRRIVRKVMSDLGYLPKAQDNGEREEAIRSRPVAKTVSSKVRLQKDR